MSNPVTVSENASKKGKETKPIALFSKQLMVRSVKDLDRKPKDFDPG